MSGDTELVVGPTRCNVDWRLVGSISCFFDFELRFLSCSQDTVRPTWVLILYCNVANRDSLGLSQSSE